jgi:glycosyltransferase involved in cell wall biosynthesis
LRRILDRDASRELFDLLQAPSAAFRPKLVTGALRNLGRRGAEGQGRLYLNVGHTGLNSPGFRQWLQGSGVRPIYLVHDLIPITHPEFCRPGEADKHRERMRTVLATATGVIANSEATLDELALFAASEKLPNPPSLAAWLGIDPLPTQTVTEEPKRPTFVTLGTIEARKNHLLLLEIWSQLIDSLGEEVPRLLIIGQRGWEAEPVFDLLDRDKKLKGHVIELKDASDADIARHLGSACALLFPSFVEGYGLPLLEAFAAGIPVIASDLPVFREISSDIPTYLSPYDRAGWKAAILDFARPDSAARSTQVQRIRSFRQPSWNRHFDAVETWLNRFA